MIRWEESIWWLTNNGQSLHFLWVKWILRTPRASSNLASSPTQGVTGSSPVHTAVEFLCLEKTEWWSGCVKSNESCLDLPNYIVLWNKERAGFSSEKDNLWIHKQGKRRDYTNNPERRSQHGLSKWKPYREQVMEWHNSVKVACGGFSRVSLDSNIDSNGMHRCKKITSLMAFMTKV